MNDGVRLSARIWLPQVAATDPVPAILEYIPYRKRDMVRIRDERNHPVFAQAGFAAIRVDMRGSGDSEGIMSDMYTPEELDDAIDVIEWIARQSWCNGSVGMMGTSWGGTSSLQAASKNPPALKAVIAVCANNNRYDDDIHHMGGCLLTDTIEWGATLPAILASPPDPQTVGEQWRELWLNRLQHLSFPLAHWIAHETCDEYWQWGSVNESPESITCPVLMIGGWADRYSNTVMNFLEKSNHNSWGIVGAWGHHYPDQANPAPGIAFQYEAIRWWDHWLRGNENGIDKEPQLRVWVQDYATPANKIDSLPGRWIAERAWPSNNVRKHSFFLADKTLARNKTATEMQSDVPGNLRVGKAAGDTGYFGRVGGLPLDQREDDEHSLVFDGEPLVEPMEILGSVELNLTVRRDLSSAMLVARLNDVHPDGSVARISYAIRNLALNQQSTEISTHTPDGETDITLQLHNTAYRLAKGHQLRLSLSSSYWPNIWPSPVIAKMAILNSSLKLKLPLRIDTSDDEYQFTTPKYNERALKANQDYEILSAPELQRWTEISADSNTQSIGWQQPRYSVYYPTIDLEFGYETTALHRIALNNPISATSRYEHTLYFSRDDWQVKVNSTAEISSTITDFILQGKIVVSENDQILFSRHWRPTIKRTCS